MAPVKFWFWFFLKYSKKMKNFNKNAQIIFFWPENPRKTLRNYHWVIRNLFGYLFFFRKRHTFFQFSRTVCHSSEKTVSLRRKYHAIAAKIQWHCGENTMLLRRKHHAFLGQNTMPLRQGRRTVFGPWQTFFTRSYASLCWIKLKLESSSKCVWGMQIIQK